VQQKAHIFEFEKGTSINPSLGLIESMATAYGISVHSLFGETDTADMLISPFALKIAIMIDREMKSGEDRYLSAVKGRKAFRDAYRRERDARR
jgi:hypothetical protein